MQLPIGYSDFAALISEKLDFVDKTLLIKEWLDARGEQVTLITRPRRFGKTLNLSMLKYFFELPPAQGKKNNNLFEHLNISQAGSEYLQHQGKYPVIFLSFKDIKKDNFLSAEEKIQELLIELYDQFSYLQSSELLTLNQKNMYQLIITRKAKRVHFENALKLLTECLFRYHGEKVVVLIDEYDTPIQSGYLNGYYEKIILFFRNFFGAGLKDNACLFRAVLTGIFRVSRESLFSGLNNIATYSVLNPTYSQYFGFTEEEVSGLLQQANLTEKAKDIKYWYNGYQIGETILYNPWSMVNCIQKGGVLKPYWINTSDDALIKKVLLTSNGSFKQAFEILFRGDSIEELIDENFVYADVDNQSVVASWSLLLMTGYLKVILSEQTDAGFTCNLAIPNQEIRSLYSKIIIQWFSKAGDFKSYNQFIQNLLEGNMVAFEKELANILEQTVSFHDVAKEPESFYHALIIGLTATLGVNHEYEIRSNRESGSGRYDYCILSRDNEKRSILFEFKKAENSEKKELTLLAKKALEQIKNQRYIADIQQRGGKHILKIGIAFSGKQFVLMHEEMNL